MRKRTLLLLLAVSLALPVWAADVAFTADLRAYSSTPTHAYLNLLLVNCGAGNIPTTPSHVKAVTQEIFRPNGVGVVSKNVTPTADITCGTQTGLTRYKIEVRQLTGTTENLHNDPILLTATYVIGPGAFDLATATPSSPTTTAPAGAPFDFTVNVKNPATIDSGEFGFDIRYGGVVAEVSCDVPTGTAAINLEVREAPYAGGSFALSAPLACGQTVDCAAATGCVRVFAAPTIPAGGRVVLTIADVQGAPTVLHVHVAGSRK